MRPARRGRRGADDRRAGGAGQSILEFAILAPFFFLIPFAILDFGRLFYAHATLQHAAREAGRFAVTGSRLTDETNRAMSRVGSIQAVARKAATGVIVEDVRVSSRSGGSENAGGPGDLVTIAFDCTLPLMTPLIGRLFTDGAYHFTVEATFKNEPFPRNLAS